MQWAVVVGAQPVIACLVAFCLLSALSLVRRNVVTLTPAIANVVTGTHALSFVPQPLIPVATILEGALLGALDTGYIAKRTGVSLGLALAIIYGSQMGLHLGLIGVWIGMGTFFASNAIMDTFRIMSPGSPLPVAALPELD